jgi:hypothetical protein
VRSEDDSQQAGEHKQHIHSSYITPSAINYCICFERNTSTFYSLYITSHASEETQVHSIPNASRKQNCNEPRHFLISNEYKRRKQNAIEVLMCAHYPLQMHHGKKKKETKGKTSFQLSLIPKLPTNNLSSSPHAPPDNTSQTPSYAPTPQTSPPSTRKYTSAPT